MSYENLSRKLFWRPNTVPLCGIFLIISAILFMDMVPLVCTWGNPNIDLPGTKHYSFSVNENEPCPVVYIHANGRVVFDEWLISDLGKLPKLIEYKLEEEQLDCRRINFKIDARAPFGRVQEVLRIIKKDGYECAGLLVDHPSPS